LELSDRLLEDQRLHSGRSPKNFVFSFREVGAKEVSKSFRFPTLLQKASLTVLHVPDDCANTQTVSQKLKDAIVALSLDCFKGYVSNVGSWTLRWIAVSVRNFYQLPKNAITNFFSPSHHNNSLNNRTNAINGVQNSKNRTNTNNTGKLSENVKNNTNDHENNTDHQNTGNNVNHPENNTNHKNTSNNINQPVNDIDYNNSSNNNHKNSNYKQREKRKRGPEQRQIEENKAANLESMLLDENNITKKLTGTSATQKRQKVSQTGPQSDLKGKSKNTLLNYFPSRRDSSCSALS